MFPQTAFTQTHHTSTDPIFTENITSPEFFGHTVSLLLSADTSSSKKNKEIESLREQIKNNFKILKRKKRAYYYSKDYLKTLKKEKDTLILAITMHYHEKIKLQEMSYDPKMLTDTIKSLTNGFDIFKSMIKTQMTKDEKRIDSLEKENTQLQKKLNLLLTNTSTENASGEPDNYYRQKCPQQNPGDHKHPNRLKYKFDTNNNSNDGDYVLCGYWKNGDLSYEIPHADKKKHGISYYNFTNSSNPKTIIPYTEGKKDGSKISFLKTKNGDIYKWKESEFSEGKIKRSTVFREDGNVGNVSLYYSNGRKEKETWYHKGRKARECWYRNNGSTSKCTNY